MAEVSQAVGAEVAPEIQSRKADTGMALLSAGSILGALAAWTCCIVPLILFSVGVTSVWIGNLTALAAYQWIFVGIAVVCLGGGFYMVYRKPKAADCEPGTFCASPKSARLTKSVLWVSTVMIVFAVAFTYLAPYFLWS